MMEDCDHWELTLIMLSIKIFDKVNFIERYWWKIETSDKCCMDKEEDGIGLKIRACTVAIKEQPDYGTKFTLIS